MKRKKQGKNFDVVRIFLDKNGPTTAGDIKRATNIKSNIYTLLQRMVEKRFIKKTGLLYELERRMPLFIDKTKMSNEKAKTISVYASKPQTTPQNPQINLLKREHEHVIYGIQQLQVTANYLNLRIRELERAASQQT